MDVPRPGCCPPADRARGDRQGHSQDGISQPGDEFKDGIARKADGPPKELSPKNEIQYDDQYDRSKAYIHFFEFLCE